MKPKIAITTGDPAGIGPEIVLKAAACPTVNRICHPLILGDKAVIQYLSRKIGVKPDLSIKNLSNLNPEKIRPGRPYKACGKAMAKYIEEAAQMALNGDVDGIVTGPINKEAIHKAGFKFPGHTEFLASLTKTKEYAMMLGGRRLKVVLVTIHESMKRIPEILTKERIFKTIVITDEAFRRYFTPIGPRIGVAALNPHGGEGGLFGDEEERIIIPAVKKARRKGIEVSNPMPADTLFYRAVIKNEFDVVICMYHDQGLIPLKLIHFEDGVNITLGLPIIRTSVDHGTAYDIAWKGTASPRSMIAAIEMAARMGAKRKTYVQ